MGCLDPDLFVANVSLDGPDFGADCEGDRPEHCWCKMPDDRFLPEVYVKKVYSRRTRSSVQLRNAVKFSVRILCGHPSDSFSDEPGF